MPTHEIITTPTGDVRTERVYDVDEMAGLLGMSARTVRRRVTAGLWPYVRGQRGRILFTGEHARAIVAAVAESHVSHDYPAHEPPKRWTEVQ